MLMAHINAPVPAPTLVGDDARAVYAVIARMLAKDPRDRYQAADDVVAALASLGGTAMTAPVGNTLVGVARSTHGAALSPTRPMVAAGGHTPWRSRLGAVVHVASRLRSRRAWAGISAGLGLLTAAYYGVHFATMHRSRCTPISAVALAPSLGSAAPFTILMDAPGPQDQGSDIDVYYDVCGLTPGTAYTTRVSITRNGFLNRLAGRVEPVTAAYNESAGSSAVRRHRTLDVGSFPPGEYTVSLMVTDAADRVRERKITFAVAR
jgi:hypothetical protein